MSRPLHTVTLEQCPFTCEWLVVLDGRTVFSSKDKDIAADVYYCTLNDPEDFSQFTEYEETDDNE